MLCVVFIENYHKDGAIVKRIITYNIKSILIIYNSPQGIG